MEINCFGDDFLFLFTLFLFPFLGSTVSRLRVEDGEIGPNGEEYCWWQVTVKGGREARNLDAVTLARVSKYMSMSMFIR